MTAVPDEPKGLRTTQSVVHGPIESAPSTAIRETWGRLTSLVTPGTVGSERLEITIIVINPATEPGPRHYHAIAENGFLILEGEVVMSVAGSEIRLTAGDFAWVPPGVVHEVRNASSRDSVRLIEIYGPAGRDFNVVDGDET